jgi:hypothetical protein
MGSYRLLLTAVDVRQMTPDQAQDWLDKDLPQFLSALVSALTSGDDSLQRPALMLGHDIRELTCGCTEAVNTQCSVTLVMAEPADDEERASRARALALLHLARRHDRAGLGRTPLELLEPSAEPRPAIAGP